MKILLLNPPAENTIPEFADEKGEGYVEADDYGYFPPLGALYVLSYAKKKYPEHEYYFIDSVGEELSYPKLEERILELKPDIIGITSFTVSLIDVVMTAETVRKVMPDSHICLGGHHATAFPYEASQLKQFDSIVVGEGEYAFAELIDCIANNKDFTKILGVYNRESILAHVESQFKDRRFLNHLTVPPAFVENVDDIPAPDRSYIQHINYSSIVGLTGKLATMITTRGCPYKCTFCDVPYKTYRQRNLDLVMDEIEDCIRLGYKEFHFYDDLFNITPQKIIDFCMALERRNINIVWDFRGRVNGVTKESLVYAKKVGIRMISFGVETGSDLGLKTLRKGSNIAQVERVFEWCRELGIKTIANYMIGLPHEKSPQDVRDNVDFLIRLNPDYSQFNILSLYPHTEVHRDAMKIGLAEAGKWEKFSLDPLNYKFKVEHWTQYMTEKELIDLQRESYRRFYFRPKYIWNSLKKTTTAHEFKSKVKGALRLLKIDV
jgi:anaerobic magnesium-protoporphyrin IX monomethyl ester cyclase